MAKIDTPKTGLSNVLDKANTSIRSGIDKTVDSVKSGAKKVADTAKKGVEKVKEIDQKAGEWYTEHNLAAKAGKALGEATAAKMQPPAEQPQTSDGSPLGLTWQERVKNGTASDDDIRQAYEAYKNGEYTPGPKTLEEFNKMGLEQPNAAPEQSAQNAQVAATEQPAEVQPQQEMTQNDAAAMDSANTNSGNDAMDNQQMGDAEAQEAAAQEQAAQEQATEEVARTVDQMSDDELNAVTDEYLQSANPDEKQKMANIFRAYKEGAIDKGTRNYFLADAIAKAATNIANVMDANQRNALWANIKSGNQVSPQIDTNTAWGEYLKTDWQEAQKLKNELRSTKAKEELNMDIEAAKKIKANEYTLKVLPKMLGMPEYKDMSPDERAQYANTAAFINNGQPLDANATAMLMDAAGNSKDAMKITDLAIKSAEKDNEGKALANNAAQMTNAYMSKFNDLQLQLTQGQISQQAYDTEMKRLLNEGVKIDNYIAEKTKDEKVKQQIIENNNKKYSGAKFKVSTSGAAKVAGLDAGAEVTGDVLANLGLDIADMISKGLVAFK